MTPAIFSLSLLIHPCIFAGNYWICICRELCRRSLAAYLICKYCEPQYIHRICIFGFHCCSITWCISLFMLLKGFYVEQHNWEHSKGDRKHYNFRTLVSWTASLPDCWMFYVATFRSHADIIEMQIFLSEFTKKLTFSKFIKLSFYLIQFNVDAGTVLILIGILREQKCVILADFLFEMWYLVFPGSWMATS